MCVDLALSKLPFHFFGIYQRYIPLLPLSVLDLNRFQYCFHETALCLSLMIAARQVAWHFPCFCSILPLHVQAYVHSVISCIVLKTTQLFSGNLWSYQNWYVRCPSNYIQMVPNLRVKNWYVTSAFFIGHKAPVFFFFSLTRLKSVGGWKSLSALKRGSSLPRPWSRSWLLWGCQYWSSYISGCQATHADG